MNESSGGTVADRATGSIADRSPNAFTGTVTSSVYAKTAGMNALTFDGSANSYVSLPSSGLSNFTTGFSAGVWVYPTSTAGEQSFFAFGTGTISNNMRLGRGGNDLFFAVNKGTAPNMVIAKNAIELNKWQYFSVVQQSSGATTLYKNGVSIATQMIYVPNNVPRTNNYIGKSYLTGPLYSGQMSDLSIWNRALSQTEVSSAASTLFTGNETGLVGYWPMKDAGLQLDGFVNSGIASVSTSKPVAFNTDFETNSGWIWDNLYVNYGDLWKAPIAPSGTRAMVAGYTTNSQTITGFKPGQPYTLSFYAAQPSGSAYGQTIQIKLDNMLIGTVTPDSTNYKLYKLPDFITDAGSHVLSIVPTLGLDGTKYLFIDSLSFTTGDPIGTNLDFEGSNGWTIADTTPGMSSSYVANGSGWSNPNAISGTKALALRGSMQQTMTGFNAGASYTLSFYAALRPGYGSQTLKIMMDDKESKTILQAL